MSYDVTTSMTSLSFDNVTEADAREAGCRPLLLPFIQNSTAGSFNSNIDMSEALFRALSQSGSALITILSLMGLPTNLLNMLVFYVQGLKTKVVICMFSQSLADFAIILTYFCWNFDTFYALVAGTEKKLVWLKFLINNYLSVCISFMYMSSFMSATVAVERCLVVLKPLRSKTQDKRAALVVTIVVANLLLLGGHFIVSAGIQVVCVFNAATNTTFDMLTDSPFRLNNMEFVDLVNGALFGMLIPGVCLFVTTVATFITIFQLRRRSMWRAQASTSMQLSAKDVALTRVLVGVSLVYIVCSVPRMAGRFSLLLDDTLSPSSARKNVFQILILTQQVFTCLNSSVNFFVYWTLGSQFRSTLTSLLPCCRLMGPGENRQGSEHSANRPHLPSINTIVTSSGESTPSATD